MAEAPTSPPLGSPNPLVEIVAGLAAAISAAGLSISIAALIFVGPLESALPRASGTFMLATAVAMIYLGLRSAVVPVVTITQDGPAVVMVAVAASVITRGGGAEEVFIAIALCTTLTGLLFLLIRQFQLGDLVRYVPTTVVGAFVAGTGLLLARGGVNVMVGSDVGLSGIGSLFGSDLIRFWLPGVGAGFVIWAIGRSGRFPPAVMSLSFIALIAAFYAIALSLSTLDDIQDAGWLIGPFREGGRPSPITPAAIVDADWSLLVGSLPGFTSVVGIAIIALLLNLTGLNFLRRGDELDVNAELREAGLVNLVIGPFAAMPCFHGLGHTALMARMGARTRWVAVGAGVLIGLLGVVGITAVGYVPRIVIGALLVTVGVDLLADWARTLMRSVSRFESTLSVVILLVIGFIGILEGIGFGVLAACAVFIVRYSRIDPLRRRVTGRSVRSRVDRSPSELAVLAEAGDTIQIFELQGYLFFGSLAALKEQLGGHGSEQRALVLDFRHVVGIDSSAYAVFGEILQSGTERASALIVSHMDPSLRDVLLASEPDAFASVHWADTLDDALAIAEAELLAPLEAGHDPAGVPTSALASPRVEISPALQANISQSQFSAGTVVIEQGAESDVMFVIQSGELTTHLVGEGGDRQRLRRFGAGALVGEIGLITGARRTAEVVADTDVVAWAITSDDYNRLRSEQPELVFELHELVMSRQTVLVASLSAALADLLK